MRGSPTRPRAARNGSGDGSDKAIRERIAAEAVDQFTAPWTLVRNRPGHELFGLGPGLYPDVVALDGSDTGTAWALEVATPTSLADEEAWDRWRRLAETGAPIILAVPGGCGEIAERVSVLLGIRFGLVYEYEVTPMGVLFEVPELGEAPRARA